MNFIRFCKYPISFQNTQGGQSPSSNAPIALSLPFQRLRAPFSLFAATLRPPPALLAQQFLHFSLSSCLFRYPPSSGRRCVQFSSLYIAKLRRAVRSYPSADPASPFARLCDYRRSPIERLTTFRRARFMHREIRRQAHYRFQRKFN